MYQHFRRPKRPPLLPRLEVHRVGRLPGSAPQKTIILEHLDDSLVHRTFRAIGIRGHVNIDRGAML